LDNGTAPQQGSTEVGEILVRAMAAGGVDHLFFTSGTELSFYQEAIARFRAQGEPAPRLIMFTHEYPCLNAAIGYASVSGRPAVTSAHVDVGTLHHGCAIHTAWRGGAPVLMTAGAPATSARGKMKGARDAAHFWLQQKLDQNEVVRGYTKWDHRLEYQDNPGLIVSRALQVALSEPQGPVYLSMPREILQLRSDDTDFPTVAELGIARPAAPSPEAIREIAARLVASERPVVITAAGRNPKTVPLLVELCELLGAAVIQCPLQNNLSFPFDHPLYLGKRSCRDADFVLALEVEVPWIPGVDEPARDAYVAVIDIDPIKQKIPTYEFRASVRLTSDSLEALNALKAEIERIAMPSDRERFAARAKVTARTSAEHRITLEKQAQAKSTQKPIHPDWASYRIAELFDDNAIVIDDTTQSRLIPYLTLSRPGSYFHNPGSGGGYAPGAAVGAKLAAPECDVVAVSGDGFYLYGNPAAALWTALRYNAPFLMIVYQNRSYTTGTVAVANNYPDGFAARGGYDGGYMEPAIDFGREAEAVGAYGETVRDPAELDAALRRGLERVRDGQPAVISIWLARLLQED
jgi:acetolactate synthase-1/2/3 large subunit